MKVGALADRLDAPGPMTATSEPSNFQPSTFNLEPPTRNPSGKVAAIFDVDNTLLPGTSSEQLFIRFLIARRHLGPRAAFGTLLALARHARTGTPRAILREHRPYILGWEVARLAALAEEAVATTIVPRLSGAAVARVRHHQAAGHLVALLSGAPPFLLAPLARHLGVEHTIGTPLAIADGAYTGELSGVHLYGPEKAVLAARFARDHEVDLAASYAYADHHTDAAFLTLFGHAVCVNPTPRLRRIAARFGWPVEAFR